MRHIFLRTLITIIYSFITLNFFPVYALTFSFPKQSDKTIENEINIYPILKPDQLPSTSVKYIYQDKEGFLWIATDNGLCFYDGYNTRIFRYDSDGNILRNNKISLITEDSKGRIWVSSVNGCFIVDKNNGFNVFIPESLDLKRHVTWITPLSNGDILISLRDKIHRIDSDLNIISTSSIINRSDEYINQIIETKNGKIFILLSKSGVILFDYLNDKKEKFPNTLNISKYNRMIEDPDNNYFWITTANKGIVRFDPDASVEDQFTLQPSTQERIIDSDSYLFINIDTVHGDLWSISRSRLCRFKRLDNDMLEYKPIINTSIEGKLWEDISVMNNGNLIIASQSDNSYIVDFRETTNKIFSLDPIFDKFSLAPAISGLAKLNNNRFLLLQERYGLILYDKIKDSFVSKINFAPDIDKNDFDIVQLWSYSENKNIVWAAHRTKPFLYLIRINGDEIYVENAIKFGTRWRRCYMVEGRNGNIFVNNGKDLYRYNTRNNVMTLMSCNIVVARSMKIDDKDNLWINDPTYGIFTISDIYSDNYQVDFFEYKDNVIMDIEIIDSGIYFCTEDGRLFFKGKDCYSPKDITENIVWDGNKFYNIENDVNSNLWIFSDQRVIEYSPTENISKEYSTLDYNIPIKRFIPGAISVHEHGEILYGGYGGFVSFKSESQKESGKTPDFSAITTTTPIFITDVTDDGHSLMFGADSLKCSKSQVILEAKQSDIIISVSNLDMLNSRQAKYAYKFEGEQEWKYLPKGENKIFLHLNKGTHKLLVKNRRSNGKWSSNTLEYTIIKKAAFYESNTAYFIYICIFLVLLSSFTVFYKRILEKRNEKRLEANLVKIKLDYFSNISHDLLTPLTIISCATEDIVPFSDSDKENLGIIRSNILRLKQLFQEILDFRKVESGNMQLNIKYGQLDTFIYNIIDCFRGVISKNSITLTVDLQDNLTGYFDPDKLEKILFNLLSNAVKYTNYGDSISINLYNEETEKANYAIIEVYDTGVGIAHEEQEKIFSPYYNNPDAKPGTSNGIGLSLCKQIAQLHKGDITLVSEKDVESLFIIKIPIDAYSYGLTHQDQSDEVLIPESRSQSIESYSKKTLLIVEDDMDLQNMIKKTFINEYVVFVANNGLEALSIVASKDINIVISDISMPGMDGITLCKRIKSDINTSHIPILLLTAGVNSDTRIDAYKAGADAYLEKPFENNLLIARIDNLINKYENAAENFKSSNQINIQEFEMCSIDEEFLNKVISIIQTRLSDSGFDINRLSSELCMSRSTLSRKLKTITGQTPIDFVHNIKMKNACKLLKETDKTITEIAYDLGIDDSRYFARRFKETFKMTPTQFRESDN